MCFTLPTTFPKTNSFIHYRCYWIYDRNYNIIPFWAEKVPLSYTFNWKMVPLPHTQFITLHASLFTAVNALSFLTIWINQGAYGKKTQNVFSTFFCLPFWAFLTTGNDRFPSPRHTWYPRTPGLTHCFRILFPRKICFFEANMYHLNNQYNQYVSSK